MQVIWREHFYASDVVSVSVAVAVVVVDRIIENGVVIVVRGGWGGDKRDVRVNVQIHLP